MEWLVGVEKIMHFVFSVFKTNLWLMSDDGKVWKADWRKVRVDRRVYITLSSAKSCALKYGSGELYCFYIMKTALDQGQTPGNLFLIVRWVDFVCNNWLSSLSEIWVQPSEYCVYLLIGVHGFNIQSMCVAVIYQSFEIFQWNWKLCLIWGDNYRGLKRLKKLTSKVLGEI